MLTEMERDAATTLLTQRIMDKVRRDGNFAYPDELEAVRSDA
jgi:hypothetical protein